MHEQIVDRAARRRRKERERGHELLRRCEAAGFDGVGSFEERIEIPDDEYAKAQRLAFEKEMLGLYVSDHPLLGAERALRRHVDCTLSRAHGGPGGRAAGSSAASSPALDRKYTKTGDLMATFVLEDLGAAIEVMVFPRTMADHGHVLEDDAIVCVKGRLDMRDDQAEDHRDGDHPARARDRRRAAGPHPGQALDARRDHASRKLKEILQSHPGDSPVFVHLEAPEKTTVLRLGEDHFVDASNGLFAELRILLGADCIT